MSDSTTIQDVRCSTTSITYNKKDLPDAALKHDIETIIYVADEMFRPYILLKDIDDNPYWRPYDGQPIEMVRKYHEWELNAQKQFKEKHRSQAEIDTLRNVLMAIQVVYGFFEMDLSDAEFMQQLLAAVATKTSTDWLCKDKNVSFDYVLKEEHTEEEEAELNEYFSLAWQYISSYFNTVRAVAESAIATIGGKDEEQSSTD